MTLEFLGLKIDATYSESKLENAIISKMQQFLLELGKGFLFEARQKRFTFDEDNYYEKLLATGEVKCIDEEVHFAIPKGWEWTRIGIIFWVTKLAGFEYTKFFTKDAITSTNAVPIVRAQNF